MSKMTSRLKIGILTAVLGLFLLGVYGSPAPAGAAAGAVSIDTNVTGNSATALGTRDACSTVAVDSSVSVDITVSNVDSIAGFEADVFYNGARISVTSESSTFILMQPPIPPPLLFDLSDSVPDSDGDYNVLVSSTGNGSGGGVVMRLTLQGVSAGESTLDLANVKMKDFNNLPVQPADGGGFFTGTVNDGRLAVGGPCSPDTDGDGINDGTDNCPAWPNPAQGLPSWSVPAGDSDCDGFPDSVTAGASGREDFIGTDAADQCADDTTVNNERGPVFGEPVSPWPPDVNDNRVASLADIILFGPWFNQIGPNPPNLLYNQRFDINASGGVTLADIVAMGPFFNKFCTP